MKKLLISLLLGVTMLGGMGCSSNDNVVKIDTPQGEVTAVLTEEDKVKLNENKKIKEEAKKYVEEHREEVLDEMAEEGLLSEEFVKEKKEELASEEGIIEPEEFEKEVKKEKKPNQVVIEKPEKPEEKVWVTGSGSKYHAHNHCGRTNKKDARQITLKEAEDKMLSPCKKCF